MEQQRMKPQKKLVVAFGDSITAGVHLLPEDTYLYKLGTLMNCVTINAGIPGQTTQEARGRMKRFVRDHEPDICLLQFGMNDHTATGSGGRAKVPLDEFRANLAGMVEQMREDGIVPLLCTIHPILEGDESRYYYARHPQQWYAPGGANGRIREYNDAIRGLAGQLACELADTERYWSEAIEAGTRLEQLLRTEENAGADDGVHPTPLGHDYYAACIAPRLEMLLN